MRRILVSVILIMISAMNFFPCMAYDRFAAADYAKKYATSTNNNYNYYSGGDCTNFASQCINAGGIKKKKPATTSVSYSDLGTWINVSMVGDKAGDGLYEYMHAKNTSVTEKYPVRTASQLNSLFSKCHVGDILQYQKDGSSRRSHSVIVTDRFYVPKYSRYEIKIAYHSNNTAPVDFRTVAWKKFGTEAYWTIIHPENI